MTYYKHCPSNLSILTLLYAYYVIAFQSLTVTLGHFAQSAAHLTVKPEVADSICGSVYFPGNDHEIFSMVILLLPLSQEVQLSVTGESMFT